MKNVIVTIAGLGAISTFMGAMIMVAVNEPATEFLVGFAISAATVLIAEAV